MEDDADLRHLLVEVLEAAGFSTVSVGNGLDGVQAVLSYQPLITTLDVNMPGIDGIEATRRIAEFEPAPLVVLLSTYDLGDLPPSARHSGAAAYVNKDDFGGRVLRRLWETGGDPEFRR